MKLYQLGEYNSKSNLSEQARNIRDFITVNHTYELIKQFIDQFDDLEEESIIILKRAIFAGYWTSYYGFAWTVEQEISFWELIAAKNQKSGVAALTLAETYRGNETKTLKEVIHLYFKAIEINSEHFYSFSTEDLDSLKVDPELLPKIIEMERKYKLK